MGRRAGRTGSRWALRALVIGGLAGAAWLLTGAAAHAADRDPASEDLLGTSLIGAVVDGDTAPPAVTKVLEAAARPLESDRTAQRVTSSVVTAPARVLTRPAEVLTEPLDGVTPKNGAVTRVVRDLTGAIRLSGGPADSRQPAPVAAPLTTASSLATDLREPEPATEPAPAQRPVDAPAAMRVTGDAAAARAADMTAALEGGAGTSAGKRHSTGTEGHGMAVTASKPEAPGGDGPAPLQVHLGAISGLSTSGPGAPTEGGSAAVLPAAVGAGPVADHRMPRVTDVEVRRHDAEAPTVSPD